MAAFLIILLIPLSGVLLLTAEHQRRNGHTPRLRKIAGLAVLAIGVLLGLLGLGLLAYVVLWTVEGRAGFSIATAILTFLGYSTMSVLLLWAARNSYRVYRLPLRPNRLETPLPLEAQLQNERTSEGLRLSSGALALAPLLVLSVSGVMLAVPVVLFGVVSWTTRRSREAQLLWTLALAVRQELPIADEVDAFAQPFGKHRQKVYGALSSRLRDGLSLGKALELSKGILPRPLVSEIRTAEIAGTLPQLLRDVAAKSTTALSRQQVDTSFALTFAYGWVLVTVLASVFGFVMVWIIPKFKNIFNDFDIDLPDLTIAAIRFSDYFFDHFYLVKAVLGIPVILMLLGTGVFIIGWGNLNVPLLMRWFPRWDAPSLLRSLSHIVGADKPLPALVDEMSQRQVRADLRGRLSRISQLLHQGAPVWKALAAEGFIRAIEADALSAASRANNLPWAMQTLADSLERTGRHRRQLWIELIKPTVVVSMGLVVGFYVVALFLPLVKLINDLC